MLVLVKRFSYTPDDTSSEVFLSVASLMLILVMSLSCTMVLILVMNFSYIPDASVNDEFVLQSSW